MWIYVVEKYNPRYIYWLSTDSDLKDLKIVDGTFKAVQGVKEPIMCWDNSNSRYECLLTTDTRLLRATQSGSSSS